MWSAPKCPESGEEIRPSLLGSRLQDSAQLQKHPILLLESEKIGAKDGCGFLAS